MYKKRILGLAIASAITLTGCLDDDKIVDQSNAGAQQGLNKQPAVPNVPTPPEGSVWPIFNPGTSALPIPNDLIFQKDNTTTAASEADGTFDVADSSPPVTTALNELSGASTIAPIDIAMSGEIAPASVIGGITVFLFALDYASGNPLQGLSIQEPPTIIPGDQPTFDVSVESFDDDSTGTNTNNYIRITPTSPLLPNKRYVVALSTNITNSVGDPIVRSPGLSGYEYLTDPNNPPASPALTSVQALIDFWESITALATGGAVMPDHVAMSYSFTTSADEKILEYIANPAQWFTDQLNSFVSVSAAQAAVEGGAPDHATVAATVAGAFAAFPSADLIAGLPTLFGTGAPCEATTGTTATGCVGTVLATAPVALGGFADLLPTPASATAISFDDTTTVDINEVSSLTGSLGITPGVVSVTQGEMTIPYYLADNGASVITDHWVADDTLAGAINTAFAPLGLSIPQANAEVTTAVNAIFPFPKKQADVTVPVLSIYPTAPLGVPATGMKSVIYQHGITLDRSAALALGGAMVGGAFGSGQDLAVIAIDQPLHGIGGVSSTEQAALAETLLAQAGSITPDGVFDGLDADLADQGAIDAAVAGNLYIGVLATIQAAPCPALAGLDLATPVPADIGTALAQVSGGACGATAQAQLAGAQILERTIANAASTIPGLAQGSDDERHFGLATGGPGAAPVAMDYSGSSDDNGSGSLFINLTNFLNTRDNLRQGTVDLLNVRQSIGNMDLNDDTTNDLDADQVYFVGHSLGTVNGLPFLSVTDNTASTTDDIVAANLLAPGGGLTRLLENSQSFGPTVVGGLALNGIYQDSSSFQAYLNVFQAALDSGDAINFADDLTTPTLLTEIVGDTVIPNEITSAVDLVPSIPGTGSISPLSGTEPIATVTSAATVADAPGAAALSQNIVRYIEGTHNTPVFPSTGTNEDKAAFAEMVAQATSIVVTGGTAVVVDNTSGIDVLQ